MNYDRASESAEQTALISYTVGLSYEEGLKSVRDFVLQTVRKND